MQNNEKEKTKQRRLRLQLAVAVGMCLAGSGLFIAGFCVPPHGEIHPSVLTAGGEFLTFAGALFGMDYSYKAKVKKPSDEALHD